MPTLSIDFVGRVERLPLRPTSGNALLPLFEAVHNSLHAIEDRFGTTSDEEGLVTVTIERDAETEPPSRVHGFRIEDNGIGLNSANYGSFLRPDSRHKQGRGGKGVGRLGWLKVFERIRVHSSYEDGLVLGSRSFDFRLTEDEQVVEYPGRAGAPTQPGTIVSLSDFAGPFQGRCPEPPDAILRALAAHFLPVIVSNRSIQIGVVDGPHRIALSAYYNGEVRQVGTSEVRIDLDGEERAFSIRHLRVSKAMRPPSGHHRMFLCGDSRTVADYPLDASLGLGLLAGGEVYVGCVSSSYLDAHINPERTGFILPEEELAVIRRLMMTSVGEFLADPIREQQERKRQTTTSLVMEYPQFLFINEELNEFIGELKPGATSKEDVFVEMARKRFRRQSQVTGLGKRITAPGSDDVRQLVKTYSSMVTTDQKGVLAEYVVRRKAVLDVLDEMRGYEDEEERRSYYESALHALVCPMRQDSTQLDYEDHNLWLLDDRLAFFAYFNSDKELRTFTSLPNEERPDLAFFYGTVSTWLGEGDASGTVVLVEFKRPNRNDYTGNDNPVRQVSDYVALLRRSNTLRDHKGRLRSMNLKTSAYHCYVVADLTETLLREIAILNLQETPDGLGRFGYIRSGDGSPTYLEVVPYEKLLRDAKLRNSIFFQKVGLTDLDPRLRTATSEPPSPGPLPRDDGNEAHEAA